MYWVFPKGHYSKGMLWSEIHTTPESSYYGPNCNGDLHFSFSWTGLVTEAACYNVIARTARDKFAKHVLIQILEMTAVHRHGADYFEITSVSALLLPENSTVFFKYSMQDSFRDEMQAHRFDRSYWRQGKYQSISHAISCCLIWISTSGKVVLMNKIKCKYKMFGFFFAEWNC